MYASDSCRNSLGDVDNEERKCAVLPRERYLSKLVSEHLQCTFHTFGNISICKYQAQCCAVIEIKSVIATFVGFLGQL